MNNYKNKWTQEEWNEFKKKLEGLSVEELKEIADVTGLKFFTYNIRKDDYINALDESDKDKLMVEYKKIVSKKLKPITKN